MHLSRIMGMALSMSEINKMLNELAQHKTAETPAREPLVAAKIKQVPKTTWPLWMLAGVCVTALAGGIGWWLGQQNHSEPLPDVQAAKAEVTSVVKADSPKDSTPEPSPAATPSVSAEQKTAAPDAEPLTAVKSDRPTNDAILNSSTSTTH